MDHDRLMEVSRFATARAATYSSVFTIVLALSVLGAGAIIAAQPYEDCQLIFGSIICSANVGYNVGIALGLFVATLVVILPLKGIAQTLRSVALLVEGVAPERAVPLPPEPAALKTAIVPPEGLPARTWSDASLEPVLRIEGGTTVGIVNDEGAWAFVRVDGSSPSDYQHYWVDGRRLLDP